MSKKPMWCLVMFDLPVATARHRREANAYRRMLLDLGFSMVQFSVYAKYTPAGLSDVTTIGQVRAGIPPQGNVRMIFLTDKQWSRTFHFSNGTPTKAEEKPEQLSIF